MGCCGSALASGEEHLRRVLQSVDLWDTTYTELKSKLIEAAKVKNERNPGSPNLIAKKVLKEKFFDPLIKCEEHKLLFDLILFQIEENSSIYSALFYLFPFLSHSTAQLQAKEFFEVIFNVNSTETINLDGIRKYLKYYYEFMLISVTDQIRKGITLNKSIEDERKKRILDDIEGIRQTAYNMKNIEREVEEFMELVRDKRQNQQEIDFATVAEKELKFTNCEVRDYFIAKYGEK